MGSVRHVFSPKFVKKLRTDPVGETDHPTPLFAAKVHQGLNPTNRRMLLKLLEPLATDKCPFANLPTGGEGVTAEEMNDYIWLRPEIEAEIKFAKWTTAGLLRHAEFVTARQPL
jgi:bifunctional non-homologous end joining protein LigD